MYYAAYGSNINLEQMAYRCPNSKVVGVGVTYGWKLYFNYHANIEQTDNTQDEVPILIWDIADEDWKNLDRYEGYPKYYVKKNIDVYGQDGKIYNCIVYVMSNANANGYEYPDKHYLKVILIGYLENNINSSWLTDALDYTNKCMIEEMECDM